MARRDWTRKELIVAFNLYCKIPFGKIHLRNPAIIALANAIGRTPSAVSWKLANFSRLDPALKRRNIAGATHGALSEVEVWNEFNNDWEKLAFESERLLLEIGGAPKERIDAPDVFPEGKTRDVVIRTRVNQGFFRSAVLAAYGTRCCVTGLSLPELLNASHIIPWALDVKNRTNPRNGLCLNAIHDRAFDCGLLTVTTDFKVRLSSKVKAKSSDVGVADLLHKYDGIPISIPNRFAPDLEYLRFHNEKIFQEK